MSLFHMMCNHIFLVGKLLCSSVVVHFKSKYAYSVSLECIERYSVSISCGTCTSTQNEIVHHVVLNILCTSLELPRVLST